MSVIRPKPPTDPLQVDVSSAFVAAGSDVADLAMLAPRLAAARADLLGPAEQAAAAGLDLPDRLLGDYTTRRPQSHLYAILQAAHRIRDDVDRLLVIGAGGCHHGGRLLVETCCHPLHNELSRGDRGGRPRVSFVGDTFDNDLVQGLLDLVAPAGRPASDDLLDRWAMLVADRGRDRGADAPVAATAVTARIFLAALGGSVGGDASRRADRLIPITDPANPLAAVGRAVGCRHTFALDPALPEASLVFTAAGLLPAAIAGIDVVRVLEGAAAIMRRFREAPVEANPVLHMAAAMQRAAVRGLGVRFVAPPHTPLEAVCRWHDAAMDRTAAGPQGVLAIRLAIAAPRRDPLTVPAVIDGGQDADGLGAVVGRRCVDVVPAAGPDPAHGAGPQHVTIHLPRVDEHAIGQLVQVQIVATAVARRLAAADASASGHPR